MTFTTFSILAGANIVLYSIATAWLMLHRDAKLLLFFTLPFKAKWLILGIMGFDLLFLLSHGSFIYFFTYLSSALIAYLFSLLLWNTFSPFEFLKKTEKNILNILNLFKRRKKSKKYHRSKVYDFKTGEPLLDDDEFMDAMLTRISLYGEDILTKKEKRRMKKISEKKSKK